MKFALSPHGRSWFVRAMAFFIQKKIE